MTEIDKEFAGLSILQQFKGDRRKGVFPKSLDCIFTCLTMRPQNMSCEMAGLSVNNGSDSIWKKAVGFCCEAEYQHVTGRRETTKMTPVLAEFHT